MGILLCESIEVNITDNDEHPETEVYPEQLNFHESKSRNLFSNDDS